MMNRIRAGLGVKLCVSDVACVVVCGILVGPGLEEVFFVLYP